MYRGFLKTINQHNCIFFFKHKYYRPLNFESKCTRRDQFYLLAVPFSKLHLQSIYILWYLHIYILWMVNLWMDCL